MASAWGLSWGRAWGNSWGSIEQQAPQPGIPPGGGNYLEWWERELRRILRQRKKPKKKLPPRKKELLEDLEEAILALRDQVAEREATEAYAQQIRGHVLESARLLNAALDAQVTNKRIQEEVAILEAYIREIDDEEAIILALH